GREALQCLLRQDFAVILLDVNMPDMDGFETAELIRWRPRFEKTPIIFLTAYNTTDLDRLKGYSLGAVDYLFLPVIPEVLKATAKEYLFNLERAVVRMDALTRDLLNYSRVVRTQIELEPVCVETVWRDVTAMNPVLQPPNTEMVASPNLLPVRAHPTLLGQCL